MEKNWRTGLSGVDDLFPRLKVDDRIKWLEAGEWQTGVIARKGDDRCEIKRDDGLGFSLLDWNQEFEKIVE